MSGVTRREAHGIIREAGTLTEEEKLKLYRHITRLPVVGQDPPTLLADVDVKRDNIVGLLQLDYNESNSKSQGELFQSWISFQ